jgi:hypothetical protein
MVDIVSIHIPKTAGSTFGKIILPKVYTQQGIFQDYFLPLEDCLKSISEKCKVVHGHFNAQKYSHVFPNAKLITWLRNPITRLISHYFYWMNSPVWEKSDPAHDLRRSVVESKMKFEEFIEIPDLKNVLSKSLCGRALDSLYFVGIQEYFHDDLQELGMMLGWGSISSVVFNKNPQPDYETAVQEIVSNSSIVSKAIHENYEDFELYKEALALKAKRSEFFSTLYFTINRQDANSGNCTKDLLPNKKGVFDEIQWSTDSLQFNLKGYTFDVAFSSGANARVDEGGDFILHKSKGFIQQYKSVLSHEVLSDLGNNLNIFELGLWKCGSLPFWSELLNPNKHVGIDLNKDPNIESFKKYLREKDLGDRIKTYWGINQSDTESLRKIVEAEFSSPLDLIIDDASHFYEQTKSSFNFLFPRLREGGVFLIEDWSWSYSNVSTQSTYFHGKTPLSKLLFELCELLARHPLVVANLTVYPGIVLVKRGAANEQLAFNVLNS